MWVYRLKGIHNVKVKQGEVEIIVNEGASMQGAQLANTMLTTIGDQLNTQISKQGIQTLDKMDVDVSASDTQVLDPMSGLLCTVKVLYWLEILSITGTVERSVSILSQCAQVFEVSKMTVFLSYAQIPLSSLPILRSSRRRHIDLYPISLMH